VSRLEEILAALVDIEEQKIAGDMSPRDVVTLVATVNTIVGVSIFSLVSYLLIVKATHIIISCTCRFHRHLVNIE